MVKFLIKNYIRLKKQGIFLFLMMLFISIFNSTIIFAKSENNNVIINGEEFIPVAGTISLREDKYIPSKVPTVMDMLITQTGGGKAQYLVKDNVIKIFIIKYKALITLKSKKTEKLIEQRGLYNKLHPDIKKALYNAGKFYGSFDVHFCYAKNDPLIVYIGYKDKSYSFPALLTDETNIDDQWKKT